MSSIDVLDSSLDDNVAPPVAVNTPETSSEFSLSLEQSSCDLDCNSKSVASQASCERLTSAANSSSSLGLRVLQQRMFVSLKFILHLGLSPSVAPAHRNVKIRLG
jgi:hypothetical protein